jgi:hypothetical protein
MQNQRKHRRIWFLCWVEEQPLMHPLYFEGTLLCDPLELLP